MSQFFVSFSFFSSSLLKFNWIGNQTFSPFLERHKQNYLQHVIQHNIFVFNAALVIKIWRLNIDLHIMLSWFHWSGIASIAETSGKEKGNSQSFSKAWEGLQRSWRQSWTCSRSWTDTCSRLIRKKLPSDRPGQAELTPEGSWPFLVPTSQIVL